MEIHLLINYGPMEAFVNRYLMGDIIHVYGRIVGRKLNARLPVVSSARWVYGI